MQNILAGNVMNILLVCLFFAFFIGVALWGVLTNNRSKRLVEEMRANESKDLKAVMAEGAQQGVQGKFGPLFKKYRFFSFSSEIFWIALLFTLLFLPIYQIKAELADIELMSVDFSFFDEIKLVFGQDFLFAFGNLENIEGIYGDAVGALYAIADALLIAVLLCVALEALGTTVLCWDTLTCLSFPNVEYFTLLYYSKLKCYSFFQRGQSSWQYRNFTLIFFAFALLFMFMYLIVVRCVTVTDLPIDILSLGYLKLANGVTPWLMVPILFFILAAAFSILTVRSRNKLASEMMQA